MRKKGLRLIVAAVFIFLICRYLPHNLNIDHTTAEEVAKTGYFKLSCYPSDIEWSKRSSYPGADNRLELQPEEMETILRILPDLKARRLLPCEWAPTGAVNRRYPNPVSMFIAFGGFIDERWNLRFEFVQKDGAYCAYMQDHGWYQLIDADEFINAVLKYYPDKDIQFPSIQIRRY